ncbi:MH1 domain containing protein [Asbolus verrucosus]|uniref:MH1 domain containing protein n=1 Tax=Asbolus verrucosus TaxID=1661398 RepID=A0A482VR59_ASBVE|nr:MH1 domain containing protein [Asbolus verrucosus]
MNVEDMEPREDLIQRSEEEPVSSDDDDDNEEKAKMNHIMEQKKMMAMALYTYTSIDSCLSALYRYVCFRPNIRAKHYAFYAIHYLVRELKEKFEELRCLTIAVVTNGAFPGQCVTVKRTKSGLIEFGGLRDFPHVAFTRIWRGLFVFDKDEIKHLKFCSLGYDLGHPLVCINPYHYEQIEFFELRSSLEDLE